jgi:hypothetical protein
MHLRDLRDGDPVLGVGAALSEMTAECDIEAQESHRATPREPLGHTLLIIGHPCAR